MTKYIVVVPFARMTPDNGTESFTHGDLVEIEDVGEARNFLNAGYVKAIETSEAEAPEIEKPKAAAAKKRQAPK